MRPRHLGLGLWPQDTEVSANTLRPGWALELWGEQVLPGGCCRNLCPGPEGQGKPPWGRLSPGFAFGVWVPNMLHPLRRHANTCMAHKT